MNAVQKLIKTVFLIAICRQYSVYNGFYWQLKTLFLTIFLITSFDGIGIFDCRLPGVVFVLTNLGCFDFGYALL